jgi:PAS domain S-box-containing protein
MLDVLYVDDEPALLELCRIYLEQTGEFRVETVKSGDEAILHLGRKVYDAIVSDYQMPGTDGINLLKQVRSTHPDIPFILFTGKGREDVVIEAINNGADFYIQKGGDPQAQFAELSHKIKKAVERKRASDALQESEEKFRTIADYTYGWEYWEAPDRSIVYINPSCKRVSGYSPEDFQNIPYLIDAIVDPRDRGIWEKHRMQAAGTDEPLTVDFRIVTKDGEIRWINHICHPVFDAGGRPEGRRASNRDITDRKQAEVELLAAYEQLAASDEELRGQLEDLGRSEQRVRESEARFKTLFEKSAEAQLLLDRTGKVTDCNAAFLTLFAIKDKEEIRGHFPEDFAPEVQPDGVRSSTRGDEIIATVMKEGMARYEWAHQKHDAARTPILTDVICTLIHLAGQPLMHVSIRDITDRKQAQDALVKSEENYRGVIENLQDVFYRADAEGNITMASPSVAEVFGYSSVDKVIGLNLARDFYVDPVKRLEFLDEIKKTGSVKNIEAVLKKKDGSPVIVSTSAHYYRDPDGIVLGVEGIAKDITEWKHAEEALREREASISSILRAAPIGIGLVSNRILLRVNARICEMTGYSPEELAGKSARILYPTDEEFDRVGREKYDQIRKYGTGTVETRWLRKDGTIINVLLSSTPLDPDNLTAGVTFTALDITEGKRAEEALRLRDRAIATSINAIVMADLNGEITYVNDAFSRIWGYSAQEAIGMPVTRLGSTEEEVLNFVTPIKTQGYAVGESLARRKDGSPFHIQISASLVTDQSGEPQAMLSTFIDITERRQAESDLRSAYEQLAASEEELRRQYEELADVQKELLKGRQQLEDIAGTLPGVIYQFYARNDGSIGLYYVSARAPDVLGISSSTADFFERFTEHVDPRDRQSFLQSNIDVIRAGQPWNYEGRFIQPSGETIWFQGISRPVSRGTELVYNGVLLDITDRKRAEEALRESEERFRRLISRSFDAVVVHQDGRIVLANDTAARFVGAASIADLVGRPVLDLVHPEFRVNVAERVRQLQQSPEGTAPLLEEKFVRLDGTVVDVEVMAIATQHEGRPAVQVVFRDISGRKKADAELQSTYQDLVAMEEELRQQYGELAQSQEDLQKSEAKFRALVETTSDFIWEVDAAGIYTYVSPQVRELLGYEPDELIGRTPFDLMPPDEAQRVAAEFTRLVESRLPISSLENTCIRKDGSVVILETSGVPIWETGGRFTGYRGIDRDITERKTAEERLSSRQTLLNAILQSTEDGILVITEKGEVLTTNQRFQELWRIPENLIASGKDEALLAFVLDQLEDPEGFLTEVKRLYGTDEERWSTIRFRDGRIFERYTKMIRIDGRHDRLWSFRDITERKKAEKALIASESRLRLITDNMVDLITQIDKDRLILYCSPSVERLTGYPSAELIGHTVTEYIHPDDTERIIRETREAIYRNMPSIRLEYRYRDKNGEYRWFESETRILYDDKGEYSGAVFISRDITERKEIEETLRLLQISVDRAYDEVFWLDFEGNILFVNDSACLITGYSREELSAMKIFELDPDFPPEVWIRSVTDLRERKTQLFTTRHRRKDGVIIDVEIMAVYVPKEDREYSFAFVRDITDRRRAEEELRESEEKYRNLFENSIMGIFQTTPEGTLRDLNPALARITGYASPAEMKATLRDIQLQLYVCPEERIRFVTMLERDGVVKNFEAEFYTKEGGRCWVAINAVPVRDTAGRTLYYEGTIEDITEIKAAEDALRESEERFRTLLQKVPTIAVQGYRPDGTVFYWNEASTRLYGYTPDEALGKNLLDLIIPPLMRPEVKAVVQRMAETGEPEPAGELQLMRRDGSLTPVFSSHAVIRIRGREPELYCLDIDLTERIRVEKALRESEEKFRAIFGTQQLGIMLIDAKDQRIVDINPYGANLMERSRDELIGRICHSFICPAEQGKCPVCDLGQIIDSSERSILLPDGTSKPVLKTVSPLTFAGHDYLIESFIDITDLKQAERALQRSNEKLNLLSSVTRHDIINQLSILQGFLRIAMMKNPDPALSKDLEKADAAATRIARQVEFTKAYQALGVNAPGWYGLGTLLERVRQDSLPLSCTCPGTEIYADPMLEKVFANLVDNAIRHGQPVTRMTVSCQMQGDDLVIVVEDDGSGIPADEKERIFGKGYGKNTGFGLFLAREILAITGISIHENGIYGRGARFEITMPRGGFRPG